MPTAVVLASNDRIVPRERSERLIESLVDPVLVETIPDSTHVSIYDMVEIDHLLRRSLDVLEARALERTPQPAAAMAEG